jgi:hypothetical protein
MLKFPDESATELSTMPEPVEPDPIQSSELQPYELLQVLAEFLESHDIVYRVVGSMASIAYGENRFTNDIDIVADLQLSDVDELCDFFLPPNFFIARHAVEDAIRKRFQFNIIHITSGLKIDVMLPKETEYAAQEQTRARRLSDPDGLSAWFAAPEDIILNKLIFFQLGGIEKHLRDIAGIVKVKQSELDVAYIEHWSQKLNVTTEWSLVKQRIAASQS